MAMFFSLRNCNIMYYITKMHVMPITFQLLLHYSKFLHVGHFKTLLQDYQTILTTTIFLEFSIVVISILNITNTCCKISTFILHSRMKCLQFGHYVCNNWQVLSAIILISMDLDNLHESIKYSGFLTC